MLSFEGESFHDDVRAGMGCFIRATTDAQPNRVLFFLSRVLLTDQLGHDGSKAAVVFCTENQATIEAACRKAYRPGQDRIDLQSRDF
jgi:hypothetical protein